MTRALIWIFLTLIVVLLICCGGPPEPIVVSIDGKEITAGSFYTAIDSTRFSSLTKVEQRQVIQRFSREEIVVSEAKRLGLNKSEDILIELKAIRNNLIIQEIMDNRLQSLLSSDSLLNQIFNFKKRMVYTSDILIPHALSSIFTYDRSPTQALHRANIVKKRLKSGELTFDEAASIYIKEPSFKMRKGVLGYLKYGSMSKSYCDAIWSATEGQVIGPLETEFGYHIVLVGPSEPVKVGSLSEEYEIIKKEIGQGKYKVMQEDLDKLSATLFKEYSVEVDTGAIIALSKKISLEALAQKKYTTLEELKGLGFTQSLATIGSQPIGLEWLLEQVQKHKALKEAPIKGGYLLFKQVQDILNRHFAVQWSSDTKAIDHNEIDREMEKIIRTKIYEKYLQDALKKEKKLTEEVIINRLLFNHTVEINESFLAVE